MNTHHSDDYLVGLVREFCKYPRETEWVEFKRNNADPQQIGETISALANSAALEGKPFAYVVWGVRDEDHVIEGTSFDPRHARVGQEELENWLLRLLEPKLDFRFVNLVIDVRDVVVLEIAGVTRHPVRFSGREFVRVGSYVKPLREFPEKERALWRAFDRTPFEEGIAVERASDAEVLELLDHSTYFDLLGLPRPIGEEAILEALLDDLVIQRCDAGGWNITNLGAVLLVRNLSGITRLTRKTLRVVQYRGTSRLAALREIEGVQGYASGFDGLISRVMDLLPGREDIVGGLRKMTSAFPELAVRELLANALIHQDFHVTGAGPMLEIFDDRVEITNPGEPLVATERFLDTPPKSRNEGLASLMRRFGICEERGTGIDKVVNEIELLHLPPPLFEVPPGSTRTILFAHRDVRSMDTAEKIRAVYQHACLRYVNRNYLTNASLRERFDIRENNRAWVSRLIRAAVQAGVIAPYDPSAAPKMMRYVPWWSSQGDSRPRST